MLRKQFFGLAFSILYLLAMIRPMLPVLEYYANYDYIANELCINKDKPYLECNGKCYLETELQKMNGDAGVAHNHAIPSINMTDYPVSPLTFYVVSIPVVYQLEQKNTEIVFNEHLNLKSPYLKGTFHPPQYLA
jgi:hypothetical protein